MKITDKLLCIPPYVSTSWNSVSSVYMRDSTLIVVLTDGEIIQIPHLPTHIIESIYSAHANFLERELNQNNQNQNGSVINKLLPPLSSQAIFMPEQFFDNNTMKLSFGNIDGIGTALQHNPAQADAPELPPQMLQRISAISKIFAPEDLQSLPRAEPQCNCIHCQLIRAITQGIPSEEMVSAEKKQDEEEISDADLTFREWDIVKSGNDLYTVTKLDSNESYKVYLGQPIGCTCGKQNCDHIVAVLKS